MLTLSIDDLYLPYEGLKSLASSNPTNQLLQGRGLPGTHDVALGERILSTIRKPSLLPADSAGLQLPFFDKSCHAGFGDRLDPTAPGHPYPEVLSAELLRSLDVVILEGWSVGFLPLSPNELVRRYAIAKAEESIRGPDIPMDGETDSASNMDTDQEQQMDESENETELEAWERPKFLDIELESLVELNEMLKRYEAWYRYLQVFIQVRWSIYLSRLSCFACTSLKNAINNCGFPVVPPGLETSFCSLLPQVCRRSTGGVCNKNITVG